MDRFLLCENPNRPKESGLFILHRLEPKCLIECICVTDNGMDDDLSSIFDLFTYRNSDGLNEQWQLVIRDYYDVEDVEQVPDSEVPRYRKMINKSWHWFKSYLEWEDNNIDTDERAKNN
jgi:hypothetical protein